MTTENKNGVLSREIKLKKDKYPTKRTMNFVEDNESASNRKTIIIFVVFMIFLGLFTKFGVIDFLNKTNQLEADYNAGNTQIAELQEKAKIQLVSATSIVEGGAHDVLLKDSSNSGNR